MINKLLIILVILLFHDSGIAIAANICDSPDLHTLDRIKQKLARDINEAGVGDRLIGADNVILDQTYQLNGYVLAVYEYDCCFEGGIVLYQVNKTSLKEAAYFNGYSKKGVFVGFDNDIVKRYLKKQLPKSVVPILDCYRKREGGTQGKAEGT